jgi:preprotein translocase subunit SecD
VSACSTDGTNLYSLGPAVVSGEQVASVTVQDSATGGTAEIQVALNDAGTAALSTMTTDLAGKASPQSQLAVYVHGRVQSAPTVMAPITTGSVTITGDFTKAQAQQIVDGLAVP